MTTMTNTTSRKATAILGWFPTTPATEREVLDMASARQIALRTRLRHHYWLTDCQPLTELTVNNLRRKMVLIDPQDAMDDGQVQELLSEHYGFTPVRSGDSATAWRIPELDEARANAVASIEGTRARAAAAGRASAAKRAGSAPPAGPQHQALVPEPATGPDDF
jgi:hypothetical protein